MVASLDEKSIPLFQQFTRNDPPDGDDICPISLIAAPGRGPAVFEARDEAVWTAKDDRYGSASVIPGSEECDRQCS